MTDQATPAIDCLKGGGEMGEQMRQTDWTQTALGPVAGWSQALRTMVGLVLRNGFPLCAWWGPELVQFYNDPFRPTLGAKHPAASGQSGRVCWAEIWHIIGPMIEGPFSGGPAAGAEELPLLIHRNGFFEETHFRVAYSPIPDETVPGTGIGGVLATVSETTTQVIVERQLRTLRELGVGAARATSVREACESAAATLAINDADVPFSMFYLLADSTSARLAATSGFAPGTAAAAPDAIDVAGTDGSPLWPLATVISRRQIEVIDCSDPRFGALPCGHWAESPRSAILVPLAAPDQARPYGVMIAGLSPHRQLDDGYRSFLELVAAQVVTAIRNARAHEERRLHADALATLDRQKTAFFSNVSHEFRTPLALMIGPTEDALAAPDRALHGDALEMVHRNELRLLKLVNSLLDFSRMEAGRVEASFQPTDLARLTADLASQFRAVMERAGLRLIVETSPLAAPAFVDREMWEKIVLNLLSNAFKHTFEGGVTVQLSTRGEWIELAVRDTGTGIAADELPRVFDRFHRVRGARSRSHEGTGIGLALAKDLVELHGGRIETTSELGVGTCFTVSIPTGSAHLPADRIETTRAISSTAVRSAAYVNDALSWLPSDDPERVALALSTHRTSDPQLDARLVLADDNADMREYLRRLLSTQWTVEAVENGRQALAAIRRQTPDLVVSDVMMPDVDGLELTRQLRTDPTTEHLPIILLSARSGEDATAEGLASGANDYIVKPFSARELVARVRVQLEIARSRERDKQRQVAESTNHAKDQFLAILGHELRNPLAPIQTALDLMTLRGDPGALRERAVIKRQVTHMIRLVDDLLDVSRFSRGQVELRREPLEIAVAVARAIAAASPLLERGRHILQLDVPSEGLQIDADLTRISQVLGNLISNAAKYTPAGGSIAITAVREGNDVVVRVRDSGTGITASMLPHVFDRFIQEPQDKARIEGGLGLGLAIVKNLVELHGGKVAASSPGRGKGAEFTIWLPAVAKLPAAIGPVATAAPTVVDTAGGSCILLVDDNQDAAEALGEALVSLGHTVIIANDGPSALRAVQDVKPTIGLLDIGLPVMDGYELARRLLDDRQLSGIRLIALTGYGLAEDRNRSLAAGFEAHLVKPVTLETVINAIAPRGVLPQR